MRERKTARRAAPMCSPRPTARAGSPCSPPAPRFPSRWPRATALARDHIGAAVVSMPCWELFEQAAPGIPGRGPRHGAAGRRRGRGPIRLGALARAARSLYRHAGLWRLGSGRGALPAFRHHRRESCGDGPLATIDRPKASEDEPWRYGLRSTGLAGSAAWSCARLWSTPTRSSRSSASTISARSRPMRICCATTACTAASPAR